MNLENRKETDCRNCGRDLSPIREAVCDTCNRAKDYNLSHWVNCLHQKSVDAGWWEGAFFDSHDAMPNNYANAPLFAMKIALIHSEVSEMLEGLRKGLPDDHLPERSMEEVEAADIFIRLADYCGARGLDLMGAVAAKLSYNERRADHKQEAREAEGGKKF